MFILFTYFICLFWELRLQPEYKTQAKAQAPKSKMFLLYKTNLMLC